MNQIVKVQRPLASSERDAPALVYAEGRERQTFVPVPLLPKAVRAALTTQQTVYCNARWNRTGWSVGDIVEDQSW